jgi:myo-inositol catabolism protein IolS
VIAQLEASLRALRTDYIDVYQSHGGSDVDFATPGLWEALDGQMRAGKIRHLGISVDPADASRATKPAVSAPASSKVTYNRLNRAAEDAGFPAASSRVSGCWPASRWPMAC